MLVSLQEAINARIDYECGVELHWSEANYRLRLSLLDDRYKRMMNKYFGPGAWDDLKSRELLVSFKNYL